MANVVNWLVIAFGLHVVFFDFVWLAFDDEEKLMMLQTSALQTKPLSSRLPKFLFKNIWVFFFYKFELCTQNSNTIYCISLKGLKCHHLFKSNKIIAY